MIKFNTMKELVNSEEFANMPKGRWFDESDRFYSQGELEMKLENDHFQDLTDAEGDTGYSLSRVHGIFLTECGTHTFLFGRETTF